MHPFFISTICCAFLFLSTEHAYSKQPTCNRATCSRSQSGQQNVIFNFSGLKRGAVSTSCYHNPCSVAKIVSFRQLETTREYSRIELQLVGGEKAWNTRRIRWNPRPHTVTVNCSIQHPSISTAGETTLIPLGSETGVPGVLVSSAELYLLACHNFRGSLNEAATKYGYHVSW